MAAVIQQLRIGEIGAGARTVASLAKLNHYPKFVHKWSRQRRAYTFGEVAIPPSVFLAGIPFDGRRRCVGIGGTRSPSVETFTLVSQVVRALAGFGFTVLSGGVPGVDLASHLATLEVEGAPTYAVLANPVRLGFKGHEWSNAVVETAMLRSGGFISEYAEEVPVFSSQFLERLLQRDRIISGCCDLFLVFECRENSATVDTAKRAMLQGKTVVAIESARRTIRVGIEQLVDEHKIIHFHSRDLSAAQIAEKLNEMIRLG